MDLAAIRRAIEDVEHAVMSAGSATWIGANGAQSGPQACSPGKTLARLYGVYAQAILQSHGIQVDLEAVCGQCCRSCPDGRCARDQLPA